MYICLYSWILNFFNNFEKNVKIVNILLKITLLKLKMFQKYFFYFSKSFIIFFF